MRYKKTILFSLTYVIFSLAFETSLIIFGGLRVPEDNIIIGPLVIIIPSLLFALIFSHKSVKRFFILFFFTSAFILIITQIFVKITGISTGFIEPIINRSIGAFLAFLVTDKLTGRNY